MTFNGTVQPESPTALEQHENETIDLITRDALFTKYLSFATSIANRKHRDVPHCVSLDELMSAARYGLLDACRKYDDTMTEQQFKSYIKTRVRGEINDYLRRCLWGGRNRSFNNWTLDVPVYGSHNKHPLPLNESLSDPLESSQSEADEFFRELISPLPKKVRLMFWLYFKEDKTMKEISRMPEIGLCESRVSQEMSRYRHVLGVIWGHRRDELLAAVRCKSKVDEDFRLTPSAYKLKQKAA